MISKKLALNEFKDNTKNHVADEEIGFLTKTMRDGDVATVGVKDNGLKRLC